MIFHVQFGMIKHLLILVRLWKIYLCLFIPNCTRNHVITYQIVLLNSQMVDYSKTPSNCGITSISLKYLTLLKTFYFTCIVLSH